MLSSHGLTAMTHPCRGCDPDSTPGVGVAFHQTYFKVFNSSVSSQKTLKNIQTFAFYLGANALRLLR